jgi:hypothetical protein
VPIPGTAWRIGLDPLIGLVPGVGDALGAVASLYVVVLALRAGAPASVAGRMVANLLVDAVVGAVPLLGDVFDAGFKANVRNVALFEAWVADPARTGRASRALAAAVVGLAAILLAAAAYGTWRLAAWAAGARA